MGVFFLFECQLVFFSLVADWSEELVNNSWYDREQRTGVQTELERENVGGNSNFCFQSQSLQGGDTAGGGHGISSWSDQTHTQTEGCVDNIFILYRENQNSVSSYSGFDIRTRLLWLWCEWDAAIWSGMVKTLKQKSQLAQNKWYISHHPNQAHYSSTQNSDSPCISSEIIILATKGRLILFRWPRWLLW